MTQINIPWRKWLVSIAIVLVVVYWLAKLLTEIIWFRQVGYLGIYAKLTVTQVVLSVVIGATAFAATFLSLRYARRKHADTEHYIGQSAEDFIDKAMIEDHVDRGILVTSLVIAVVFVLGSLGKAMFVLQCWAAEPFGVTDPLFGRDIGFFVFRLPLLDWLMRTLTALALIDTVLLGLLYFYEGKVFLSAKTARLVPHALTHMSTMVAVVLVLKAGTYYFAQFALVWRQHDRFAGASYADAYGQLPLLRICAVLCVLAAIALVVLARRDTDTRRLLYLLGAVVAFCVVGRSGYPKVLQYIRVTPQEATAEGPFIDRSIAATWQAYMLDAMDTREYEIEDKLTLAEANRYPETIDSVRLWDHRPLLATYSQQQQITTYYAFTDIDIDRYHIGGRLRQVALGARELYVYGTPRNAQTWINEHITYTHGYGLAMSPVNDMTREGLPVYWWSGIPPKPGNETIADDMKLTRPGIYFGEFGLPESGTRSALPQAGAMAGAALPSGIAMMGQSAQQKRVRLGWPEYVLVGTSHPELDYQSEDGTVPAEYTGQGGVPIGSLWRRLLFAVRFKDPMLLLSREVKGDSRLIMYRHILERIHRVFPFLAMDSDPYLFVDSAGNLEWIADAYTYTTRYPYSTVQPVEGSGVAASYLRNSVKIVVDAYDGTMEFYRVDEADPICRIYDKLFPGLFKPASAMPEDVKAHLRYPRGLFLWQTNALLQYHVRDSALFYGQEDTWQRPTEVFGARADQQAAAPTQGPGGPAPAPAAGPSEDWQTQAMEPYFVLLPRPDGGDKVEFMQVLPMVRVRRPNMASWLAGWWDAEAGKGSCALYEFSRTSSVYGPMQIEARIDKDPAISEQLTWWSRGGSQVIRGNLLAIPIGKTILWVEPLYIQASTESLPTLQKVIVVFGSKSTAGEQESRVVMADSFREALALALSKSKPPTPDTSGPSAQPAPEAPAPAAEPARSAPEQAVAPSAAPPASTGGKEVINQLADLLDKMEKRRQDEAEEIRQMKELLRKNAGSN